MNTIQREAKAGKAQVKVVDAASPVSRKQTRPAKVERKWWQFFAVSHA